MLDSATPVRSLIDAVASAAARWCDGDFPPRVRALAAVCARTGYTEPAVEYAFDRLFSSLTVQRLAATVVKELGSLDVLDRFTLQSDGVRERALPIGRVCVISSRTTVGVAIVPAVFALIAKCDVLVKDRADGLVNAFFATLREELDEFGSAAAAQSWDGAAQRQDLRAFDAVVAFGSDETLAEIAALLPLRSRMIPYPAKVSIGYVEREALGDTRAAAELASRAARDLVLYESEGCMSLHALFVERGAVVAAQEFAALLARAVDRASIEFPPPLPSASAVARVAAARDLAAFRAAGGTGAVHSDAAASYLVEFDPPHDAPPAMLPRSVAVRSVDGPSDARAYVVRHALPIEALALAAPRADTIDMATTVGAARVTLLGELQSPPVNDRHGGRPRIAEFVRWVSDET
jgi:hypothetical protein